MIPWLSRPATRWMYADGGLQRHDQAHLVSDRITTDLPALARQVAQSAAEAPTIGSSNISKQDQAQVSDHIQRHLSNSRFDEFQRCGQSLTPLSTSSFKRHQLCADDHFRI